MAMPQRDDTIEAIKRPDALLEYAVMHGDKAWAESRGESVAHEGTTFVGNVGNPVGNVITGDSNLDQVIMTCLRDDVKMSAAKIAKVANVTTRTIERAFTRLKASGRIRRKGGTRGVWEIVG